ncbi:DedA family protein [Myxococcus vastator]|uniref:DedA family protein n=1 Tax=Myxococcus vastator TaxID=2709664 RepID=UPI0013D1EB93|nr:DedA family protein [Myxococcus vastator]
MAAGPVPWLLTHGSAALLFAALVAGGLGVPIPEDLVLLSLGILAHRDVLPMALALAVAMAGVLCGDTALFLTARRLGPALYEHPRLKKLLPPERRERLAQLYARHGGRCVFVGRFLSVLRGAVFIMAAVQGMRLRHFLLWDGLALCISAPVVLGLGYAFSHSVDAVAKGAARAEHLLVLATTAALLAVGGVRRLRRRQAQPPR